jgi:transcriptional regulator with XRE-family HTH domain
VDDQRIGRVVRALRRRLGWRQTDLAKKSRCSQKTVSRSETGHLPNVLTLRRILGALDAALVLEVRWRAGALDRLLDEDHSVLVGAVTTFLTRIGWEVHVEVTYSDYGDRGSIDILAWHAHSRVLLVVEIKSDLAAIEGVLRKLDEKIRVAPKIARERYSWQPVAVSRLLVMTDTSTLRRRVERHEEIFRHAFPTRGTAVRRWLTDPAGTIAALWFLSPSHRATHISRRGGRERIRRPKPPSPSRLVTA